jgi:hypothetical protein
MKKFREWLSIRINEIDWKDTFSDVRHKCMDTKAVVEYLNDVKKNSSIEYGSREKFSAENPFVHSKSSFFNKDEEEVDIGYFIKQITKKPNNIINTNEKILKSGGPNEYVYKTGIPAFRGIAYDIEEGKFHYINTCPGAGSCVVICYARRGRYIQYPNAYDSMTRRLNYLLNFPKEYEKQMHAELREKCEEHKALKGYKSKVLLRWNDSGDFFTKKYTQIANDVMRKLSEEGYNIDSYAYTKIASVANSPEFGDATFSTGSNKQQSDLIDTNKQKVSIIVPQELFKDLDLMKISDEQILKSRIASKFKLNISDILTYDEMMTKLKLKAPKWHVIVTPNDGDDAAFRKDVKTIFLTQH